MFYIREGEKKNVVNTKYGKYILRDTGGNKPNVPVPGIMPVELGVSDDWGGIQQRLKWTFVSKPVLMVDEPHSHDFDEFLCFFSCNPENKLDFDAEVELSLGPEGEKQIITSPSIVCIPEGLIHCPINFKAIDKPVLFVHVYIAPEYVRKPVS